MKNLFKVFYGMDAAVTNQKWSLRSKLQCTKSARMRILYTIALAAMIGFSMAGCDNGTTPPPYTPTNTGITPTITTSSLPNGTVGTAYSQTLMATGDTPITWSLNSGTLPTGLNLLGSGTVSGTPTTAGTFTFTVKATNFAGSDTKQLSITIAAGGTTNLSLDGVWELDGGMRVTVSGSTGIISSFSTTKSTITQSAVDKGYISIGSQFWRNLTSTGNLTWSGQELKILFYNSSPNVAIGTVFENSTFTLSPNGQTLTVGGRTWTRR